MATTVGSLFAGHRLEAEIGRGGMGVVFRAIDLELDRTVALKLIAPEYAKDRDFRERFKRESRLAASIRHPHVIAIHRAGEENEQLFITMDYVEGTDLKQMIALSGRVDPPVVAEIVAQVASGLEAAHARGLVHRDVKPANVLIETGGRTRHAYLTDFGLTKHVSGGTAFTKTGIVVGTTDYLAPEQLEGRSVDARADIYALGCMLYEALAGEVPFPRENEAARMWAHVSDPVPSVMQRAPGVSPELDAVVCRAMAKAPDERYWSAEEMGQAVRAAVGGDGPPPSVETVAAAPGPAPPTVPPPPSSSPTVAPVPPPPPPTRAAEVQAPSGEWTPPAEGTAPPPAQRSPRRAPLIAGLLLVVAVVVGAVALLAGGGGGDEGEGSGAAPALPAGLDWRPLKPAPIARQQLAATEANGTIWVFGGLRSNAVTATPKTEGYDTAIDTWKSGPDMPLPLHHASAATYRGDPVVIGGWVPDGSNLTATVSNRVFTLRGGAWAELPKLTHPRAGAAAAVVGDRIVVVGGQANGQLVRETEVYDGKGWKDAAAIPTPREHMAAASDGKYLYAVGGRDLSSDKNEAALERYDPAGDEWTELPDMPTARGGLGAAVVEGRLVAVGGETPAKPLSTVEAYDLKAQKWSALPSLPTPRHGLAAVVAQRSLYAIGGALAPTHAKPTHTAEVLDFGGAPAGARPKPRGDSQWRAVKPAPTARQQLAATASAGTIWVFGGLAGGGSTPKTEGYDPAIDTWKSGPDMPLPLHHAAAATYKGDPVVIGGWVPDGSNLTATVSNRVFALRGGAWVELPKLNYARAGGAAAVVGGKIVVVGGQRDGELVTETEVFDGKRWEEHAPIPTPREHMAAASDGKYLYAVGGRNLSSDKNEAALERFDPEADKWTELREMPTPRGGLGAAVLEGRLVAVGGETPTKPLDTVEAYNLKTQKWSALSPLPTPRHGLAAVVVQDSLYALGGALAPSHEQPTPTAEVFNLP